MELAVAADETVVNNDDEDPDLERDFDVAAEMPSSRGRPWEGIAGVPGCIGDGHDGLLTTAGRPWEGIAGVAGCMADGHYGILTTAGRPWEGIAGVPGCIADGH